MEVAEIVQGASVHEEEEAEIDYVFGDLSIHSSNRPRGVIMSRHTMKVSDQSRGACVIISKRGHLLPSQTRARAAATHLWGS